MKILVVEDELKLQKALQKGLTIKGYAVDTAANGEEALELYAMSHYDLIVLDLNMPLVDGYEVLRTIRERDLETKILILSARSDIDDKVRGLDSGANDYLGKPFHFSELEARVRALLLRQFVLQEQVIQIGDLSIDIFSKSVTVHGNSVGLTVKEYGILEFLVLNRPRILSLEQIMEHVWDYETDSLSSSIKVHLNNLRKKIGNDIIKNKRGVGYYVE